ncbi:MAG: hypothetical protein IPG51_14370 [Chloroflexi bacterium]|nr:hypothetical protein [Chloroflexota bacterium]
MTYFRSSGVFRSSPAMSAVHVTDFYSEPAVPSMTNGSMANPIPHDGLAG